MARTVLALYLETEIFRDCLDDLMLVHEALTRRHGDRFRRLERDIEKAIENGEDCGAPEIEPGRMVLTPPAHWVALVQEARALGVI